MVFYYVESSRSSLISRVSLKKLIDRLLNEVIYELMNYNYSIQVCEF